MWETWKKLVAPGLAWDRLSSSRCSHLGVNQWMEELCLCKSDFRKKKKILACTCNAGFAGRGFTYYATVLALSTSHLLKSLFGVIK